ncbi:hypothetical protein CRG98_022601 [Punica granatum]|uniref:Uncharacterized protein n=1 Tax=Punica granatum TaxID=22663 RepID=A0A2I0JL27_PUNGR|nr:hypothetical protein CRG98_022601 [Punica granatum]
MALDLRVVNRKKIRSSGRRTPTAPTPNAHSSPIPVLTPSLISLPLGSDSLSPLSSHTLGTHYPRPNSPARTKMAIPIFAYRVLLLLPSLPTAQLPSSDKNGDSHFRLPSSSPAPPPPLLVPRSFDDSPGLGASSCLQGFLERGQ